MIYETKYSEKRIINVLIMFLFTIVLSISLGLYYKFLIDQILSLAFLGILFFFLFILCLISSRVNAQISNNISNSYRQIRNMFCLFCIIFFSFSFLPEFISPMLLVAVFFVISSNQMIGMAACIYFDTILCLVVHADFYELSAYILLTLFGVILTAFLQNKAYRVYVYFVILALNTSIPSIFHFLSAFTFDKKLFLYSFISGIASVLLIILFFDKLVSYTRSQKLRSLNDILDETYPLAMEFKEQQPRDYTHALKVSALCEECANLIHVDTNIAKAAGLYYKIGRLMQKKAFVEESIQIAQSHLFPLEVTRILAEYNGELHLPTSQLSAMVHLIDAIVTKFEIIGKDTLESSWNHDVVIYQAFNEISASGIYDESGLTMNQFLKIREFFVKGNNIL